MQRWGITFLILLFLHPFWAHGTDRVSAGSGAWTAPGTWSPSGIPLAGDNITISSGHTVTIIPGAGCTNLTINGIATYTSVTTAAVSGNLVMNNGGSITGTATGTLNVSGTLSVTAGGSATIGRCNLTITGATTVDGTLTINSATGTKTFGDITISSTGIWTNSGNSAIKITGSLTNNKTLTSGTGRYTFTGTAKTISGSSAFAISSTSVTGTYTNTATFSVGTALSGAGSLTQGSGAVLNIGGTSGITTLVATVNTNTVTYNGAGAQTVKNTTYYNLTITSGNTATAGGAFTCSNNLSLTSGTFASGANTITVSGATTISGGTLSTSNSSGGFSLQSLSMTGGSVAGSATGNVNVVTTLGVPSGTATIGRCNLNVTGATTIAGSLTFNSATGNKILGDVSVSGTGSWISSVAIAFKINGNLSNSGTFTASTGVYTVAGTSKTISGTLTVPTLSVTGTYTNNATFTSSTALRGAGTFSQGATGTLNMGATAANFSVTTFNASASGNTVNYNRAGAQSVRVPSDVSYHHLTLSGSNNKTLLGTTDVNGDLTISACTLVASSNNMTLAGNWLNTSGLFTPGTNTVTLDGSTQSITKSGGETFNHLVLSGTGTKTLGSDITTNGNLAINSDLNVSSSNFSVTVKGNWTNNGTFTQQSGTVTFSGGAAQTIGGTSTTDFNNITQSNSFGVSLAHAQNLIGVLTISAGTFTTTGFNFTLNSTSAATASIAAIPTGANFAGNIIMQRYTGTGPTDWRFLCSPVSGATIADWADDFPTSGFTGSTDPSSTFVSIYAYSESVAGVADSGYVAATSPASSISNGNGFWVYLGPNPVTYSVTGPPNTFTVTPSVSFTTSGGATEDGWNLISNPYPSAIDWDDINWTKTNMDDAVYIYNSATGSFASYVAGLGVNGGSRYIASQQAFWVKANAASPVIKLVENVKSSQNPTHMKSGPTTNVSHYPMAFKDFPVPQNSNANPNTLKLTASGNGFDDETIIRFTQGASTDFDAGFDAWKMQSLNPVSPNISSVINDSVDVSINSYPDLNTDVTIPIRMLVPSTGTYSIRRDSTLMLPMSSCLILEDLATGNMIDLRSVVSYSFTIADTTSAPRFLLHVYAPISKQAVKTNCSNDSTGMAIAKGTGTGPWDYVWKDAGGTILKTTNNSSQSDTLFGLSVGVYTVEVSSSVCGMVADTIEVKSSSTLQVLVNYSDVTCNGSNNGSAYTTISGGNSPYSYLWSTGGTGLSLNNLPAGSYSVLVTDAGGCSQVQTVLISEPGVLKAAFKASDYAVDLSYYNSISFTDTSLGATSRVWDFGDTTALDSSINPTHYYTYQGIYSVMLVVSNGNCSDSSYSNIVVTDSLNATGVVDFYAEPSVNTVYENGGVFLVFDLMHRTDVCITVYNAIGESVFVRNVSQMQKNKVRLDLDEQPSGIYVCVIDMKDVAIAKKIILPTR